MSRILLIAMFTVSTLIANAGDERELTPLTFRTTKVVNAQSTETLMKRKMDFRVTHRFGSVGEASGGGIHTLYGLDNASNIRISFDYGVTKNLMVGIGRSKIREQLDGFIKYKILSQTVDNHVPVSLAWYSNMASIMEKDKKKEFSSAVARFSYVHQLIIARKFGSRLSVEALPTVFHRNYVPYRINSNDKSLDQNDILAIGGAARFAVSASFAVVADYFHPFSNYRINNKSNPFYNPVSVGFEIGTGGHVFHLNFTNAAGIIENTFLADSPDSWNRGGYKFGFNISRVFTL